MRRFHALNQKREADAVFSLFQADASSRSEIERRLRKVSGIKKATVDFVANCILVRYDPDRITVHDIRAFIERPILHA